MKSRNLVKLSTALLHAWLTIAVTGDDLVDYALVSIADERKVSLFELSKGPQPAMRPVSELKVEGDPGSQYFDVNRSILYLGLRNAGKITVVKFDRQRKQLKQIDEISVDRDPAYLHLDRTGHWLLAAYYATGRVSAFALKQDGAFDRPTRGTFAPGKVHWLKTAPRAHAILPDSTNGFVFVPHTGPNCIFQFRFNSQTGKLVPNHPAKLQFQPNTGPRHMVVHPKSTTTFFAINEQGSSVTMLKMNPRQGTLEPSQTLSTLPETFEDRNACADLEITHDGRFLYAANRGHDSIALFQTLPHGKFKRMGIFETEKTPRQFSLSPDNTFLVSAGQGSNRLAIFRINPENGHLVRVGSQHTGKKPWWITLVD